MKKKLTKAEKKAKRLERRQAKREKGMGFINEFKAFILRGNVVDMSVGVIVGSAFSKITSTLTNQIFIYSRLNLFLQISFSFFSPS